jgi:hypothetical protein
MIFRNKNFRPKYFSIKIKFFNKKKFRPKIFLIQIVSEEMILEHKKYTIKINFL